MPAAFDSPPQATQVACLESRNKNGTPCRVLIFVRVILRRIELRFPG